jgi:hypothetical protein
MCLAMYLASDYPLLSTESRKDLGLIVRKIEGNTLRNSWPEGKLSKHHRYEVSYEGCACALLGDGRTVETTRAVQALGEYLKASTPYHSVELYMCWMGDEDSEIQHHDEIPLNLIVNGEADFKENQFVRVLPY